MGRNSLLLVIGFNIIFLMMGFRLSNISSSAYEKYRAYAELEQAALSAESASNIAISDAFFSPPTTDETTTPEIDFPYPGQEATIQIRKTPNPLALGGGYSLTITGIHRMPLLNQVTMQFDDVRNTTVIQVRGNSFSQYVMYSVTENIGSNPIYWMTGEVCRGPLHTQDNLYVNGNPRFEGKVTIFKKLKKAHTSDNPDFVLGYTEGVNITLPTDLTALTSLGATGGPNASYDHVKVFVQFHLDGKVTVRTTLIGSTVDGWTRSAADGITYTRTDGSQIKACSTYASIGALTSNEVLLVNNAELHVKGVLDGRITLGAVGSGSLVMLDSSVVYAQRPPTPLYPTNESDDLLGIVSEHDIKVTDTAHPQKTTDAAGNPPNYATENNNNNNSALGVNIDASMFSLQGGFGAERYDTRGDCGYIRVSGGIQQQGRDPVGQMTTHVDGFRKDYAFDNRLYTDHPAGYPTTPFLVQDWKDSTDIPVSFWE